MKSNVIYACIVILVIWMFAYIIPDLYKVAKKKQAAEDGVEMLQRKVNAKKAAGEMTNDKFIDKFIKEATK